MKIDDLPLWLLSGGTFAIVVLIMEAGYRWGRSAHRKSKDEKESPVSAIAGSILGLLAFMQALTFNIAYERYDTRKSLVREEANILRTAFARSAFLPETDRAQARQLLRNYVDARVAVVAGGDLAKTAPMLAEAARIQDELWRMAVVNARKDMNSDVAALYVESVNDLCSVHALRVAVGLQARIPGAVWTALFALVVLGGIAVGYEIGIAASKRSFGAPILALAFTIVLSLIALLDVPHNRLIPISQQPLLDLRAAMDRPQP
ncbi:MAG TPA: DUF4239 domain-containing protein [Verrucomicrobiota bacterium]|nr:hypothetical protein [Verrucomicrobiales bacterium]HRI12363.1 DUF4239 domain-containing protein [Verrucomicrobiota bacterium]